MKRKFISLLLAVTLTASFTGCGKEDAKDSSSNVKEETEKVDSQNNQAENSDAENDIVVNESPKESIVAEEEQIIKERTKQWFDDLDWDATEEEKEALYQEFCAERIPYKWTRERYEFDRADYIFGGTESYRLVPEGLNRQREFVQEYYNWSVTGDSFIYSAGENGDQLYYMEYDGTIHFIAEFDEKIGQISAQKEYCFLITENGEMFRVHYLLGQVDYVTTITPGTTYYIYDSKSIFYFVESIDEVKVRYEGNMDGGLLEGYGYANYFNMETGQWEEPPAPGNLLKAVSINAGSRDFVSSEALYEEFCKNRVKFVPDDENARIYNYEITKEGHLVRWHKSEDRADAEVIDYYADGLYMWNEYIYYMGIADPQFRIDGVFGNASMMVSAYGDKVQLFGNNEYIFFVIDGMVKLYHIPSEKGQADIIDIGTDSTHFTIYDNRSFLWKDSEGNTHYYDMDASSELPVPADAILWEDTVSEETTLAELFESEINERLLSVNYDESLGVVRSGQCAITMQDYAYGAVNGQGKIIVPHEYATCGFFVSPEGYFYLRGKYGEDADFDNHYFNASGEELLAANGASVIAEDTVIYEIRDVWGKETTKIVAFDLIKKEEWFRYDTGGNKEVTFTHMQDGTFYFLDRNSCELFKVSRDGTKELVHVFDDALYIYSSMITKDYMLLINQYDIAVGTEVDFVLYNIVTQETIKVDFCDFFIEKYPNFWENYDTVENYSNASLNYDLLFNGGAVYHSGTISAWEYYNCDTRLTDYYLMDLSKARFDGEGKVINWDEICILESPWIAFSKEGVHDSSYGYIDNTGKRLDNEWDYKMRTQFTHGYALVLDYNGMAYFIDANLNRVSSGYPADEVSNGNSCFTIRNGDDILQIAVVE